MKKVQITMNEPLVFGIRKIANIDGLGLSETIRRACQRYLEYRNIFEHAAKNDNQDIDLSKAIESKFKFTGSKKDFVDSRKIVDAIYDNVGYSGERAISMAVAKYMAARKVKKVRFGATRGYLGIIEGIE